LRQQVPLKHRYVSTRLHAFPHILEDGYLHSRCFMKLNSCCYSHFTLCPVSYFVHRWRQWLLSTLPLHPCHSYGLSTDYATLPSRVLFELWRITYCWIGNDGYFATKHCSGKWTDPDGRNRLKVGAGR